MKAKPMFLRDGTYYPAAPGEVTHLILNFPGPLPNRIIPLTGDHKWAWNGDTEKPTLSPSILTRGEDADGKHVCHSFVREGKVEFLSDCSHEFAGQTLDLLEVEE